MTAYLHELACTDDPCCCRVLYPVAGIEQKCDNGDDGETWDQDAPVAIAYTRCAPALPADPRFGRGVVVRGSGE